MQVFTRTQISVAILASLSFYSGANAQQALAPIVVTANPLGGDINDLISPVSVLRGEDLAKKQSGTR